MSFHTHNQIFILITIFCLNVVPILGNVTDEVYIIKATNSVNQLVLDARDPDSVKLETFNGSDSQFWRFEVASAPGLFYIVNHQTQKLLDFRENLHLFVSPRTNSLNQQWILNANGRLVSAARPTFHVVPWKYTVQSGIYVHIWEDKNGTPFTLEKKILESSRPDQCPEDDYYVIRSASAPNGVVLDGTDPKQTTVKFFNGFSTQLWKFQRGSRPGVYYIENKHTGLVLDFEEDTLSLIQKKKAANDLNQQWSINRNGTIVNMGKDYNIDIFKANYTSGNKVIVWLNNGCPCQGFNLERKI